MDCVVTIAQTKSRFLGSLLVISPDELVRIASDSAKFECHFDSCARLLWNGPGIGLGVPQHYTITTGEYSTTLTINNLTESDEGPYFCTCNGRNSTQADLIVHRKYNSMHIAWCM